MNTKRIARIVGVAAVAIAVCGFGLYGYLSPSIWLQDVKRAAHEGDKEGLRDLVDFDSVKAGLKEDLKTHFVLSRTAELTDNPFAALGAVMASMMVDPMIEMIVSPSGIAALIEKGRVQPTSKGTTILAPSSIEDKGTHEGMSIERGYVSFSRYRLHIRNSYKKTEEPIILTLRREGVFSWRLTRISLPASLLGGAELPQRPNLIRIEASDVHMIDAGRPSLIRLTATLRNYAYYELAYPSLDLVLTSSKEHALARRIFSPEEYLSQPRDPKAGIPPRGEVTAALDLDIGELNAAGFRLDLRSPDREAAEKLQIDPNRIKLMGAVTGPAAVTSKSTVRACLEWGPLSGTDVARAESGLARRGLAQTSVQRPVPDSDGAKRFAYFVRDPDAAVVAQIAELQRAFPGSEIKAGPCPVN